MKLSAVSKEAATPREALPLGFRVTRLFMWGPPWIYSLVSAFGLNPAGHSRSPRTPSSMGTALGGTSPLRSTRRASAPARLLAWPGPLLRREILGVRQAERSEPQLSLPGGHASLLHLCAFMLRLPHLSVVALALPLQAKRELRPRLAMDGLAFGRPCTELFFSWLCLVWFALLLTALIYF